MNLDTLIKETAETLRMTEGLETTDVIEEDLGDVAKKIETSVAKTSRCITVGLNGCDHVASQRQDGDDPDALYVEANLVIAVFEKPVVNRKDEGAPRLMGMAARIARAVDGTCAEGMTEAIHFVKITPIQELDRGVITCDVVFRTKNSI